MSKMTPQRWQRVTALLDRVLPCDPGDRQTLLQGLCDGDDELRREVESLLRFEEKRVGVLETPVLSRRPEPPDCPSTAGEPAAGSPHPEGDEVGLRIGHYRVLDRLGSGGMGTVFLAARVDDFRKQVALKRIHRRKLSDELRYRFENERQILADLEHPNIARILDGGTAADGLPYFAMEFVEGQPIDRYCDQRQLTIQERLRLFLQVCSALQTALGNALVATKGYGVEEVGQSFTRAYELGRQLDEPEDELVVLWGLALFRVTRGEVEAARQLGDECLHRGAEPQDNALLLLGHRILGMTLYFSGEPAAAREHLETGLALSDSRRRGPDIEESLVYCRSLLGLVLWILGYPDQALERCHEAVSMASRIDHPMSLASTRYYLGMVRHLRREVEATRREAEALFKIATDHGFPLWSAWAKLLRGWARSVSEPLQAVPQLCQALASWRATGARARVPTFLAVLASAFCRVGDTKMGLSTTAEALEMVAEYGEHLNEAELLRLEGQLLEKHQPAAAERSFRQAIAVARRQQALSWELRSAMSLGRLLVERGAAGEAKELLSEVCGRFTEGLDTVDLKAAREFLERLPGPAPLRAVSS